MQLLPPFNVSENWGLVRSLSCWGHRAGVSAEARNRTHLLWLEPSTLNPDTFFLDTWALESNRWGYRPLLQYIYYVS